MAIYQVVPYKSNIIPDLTVLGKIIAGGNPAAAAWVIHKVYLFVYSKKKEANK